MPNKTKGFAYGSIVTGVFMFIFTGIFGWFGSNVVSIPMMKHDILENASLSDTVSALSVETVKLRLTLDTLNTQAKRTNDILQVYVSHNAKTVSQLISTDVELRTRLMRVEKDCDRHER